MYDIFIDQETSLDRGLFYAVSVAVNWTAPSDAVTWTAPSDAAPDPMSHCPIGADEAHSRMASQGPLIDHSIIICFQ